MRIGLTVLLSTLLSDAAVTGAAVGFTPGNSVARPVLVRLSEREAESGRYAQELWKRRGGGGRGGKGGGSSGSGSSSGDGSSSGSGSSSGGSSSGGSSSGSSSSGKTGGSSSSGSSSSGRTGSSSSTGGATKSGSGPAPRFGGGSYYAGGARQPYSSGSLSPSGIRPLFIGAGLGALVFYPHGAWPNGAYFYPYSQPYHFYNASSGRDESEPVKCACEPNVECGCDDPGGANTTTVLNELIGNGSYAALDKTEVMVANNTILINGTLPNGTTASGGENAGAGMRFMLQNSGWWPVVATVCAAVFIA